MYDRDAYECYPIFYIQKKDIRANAGWTTEKQVEWASGVRKQKG